MWIKFFRRYMYASRTYFLAFCATRLWGKVRKRAFETEDKREVHLKCRNLWILPFFFCFCWIGHVSYLGVHSSCYNWYMIFAMTVYKNCQALPTMHFPNSHFLRALRPPIAILDVYFPIAYRPKPTSQARVFYFRTALQQRPWFPLVV